MNVDGFQVKAIEPTRINCLNVLCIALLLMYQTFKSSKALKSYEASKIGYSKAIDVLVRASFVACDVVTQQQMRFRRR